MSTTTPKPVVHGAALFDGTRAVRVDVDDGITVLVTPRHADDNKRALQVATRIADAELDAKAQQVALEALQHANDVFATRIRALTLKVESAEQRLEAAETGRRRFFGPVLLVPVRAGEWSGEVWLQDSVKGDRGTALRFASLMEVRALHPELWIVEVRPEGVLLDAAKLPTKTAEGGE